jgi:hypothetical protein
VEEKKDIEEKDVEEEKEDIEEKVDIEKKSESTLITKADRSTPYDYSQPLGGKEALEKGAEKIITDVGRTETVLIQEAQQKARKCCDCCCSCCRGLCGGRSCGPCGFGFGGDILAIVCCPLTVCSLLSCMCFKVPKMFVSKITGRTRKEESEFEESVDAAIRSNPGTGTVKEVYQQRMEHTSHPTHTHEHGGKPCTGHHGEKQDQTATDKLKKTEEEKGKVQESPKMDAHRSYFFPNPDVEDDHPGSDKPAGR